MAECNFISPLIPKENIQGAHRGIGHISHYMGIDRGGFHTLMSEKLLYLPDVDPVHEEMGGKTVAERMHRGVFHDAGFYQGVFQCGLYGPIADVMALYPVPAGNCEGNPENRARLFWTPSPPIILHKSIFLVAKLYQ